MVDVQFEEDAQFNSGGGFRSRQILGVPATPGMVVLLGKLGVRDEKVAGYILVAIAIIAFIVSIFIFASVFGRSSAPDSVPDVPGAYPPIGGV